MSRSRRGRNTNESPLDTLNKRHSINHANGQVFYQILAPADSLLPKAHVSLKQCLKLLDLKCIVNSQPKEGRHYGQFRTIVLCSAADLEVLGAGGALSFSFLLCNMHFLLAACVKCHKTDNCGLMEVIAFGISPAHRKQGYGALLAGIYILAYLTYLENKTNWSQGALKETSKNLKLECIVCVYFDSGASRFWDAMEFTQESLSAVEQVSKSVRVLLN